MQFLLLSWAWTRLDPETMRGEKGRPVSPVSTLHLPVPSLTLSFLPSLNLSTEAAGSERPAPSAWWAAVLPAGSYPV